MTADEEEAFLSGEEEEDDEEGLPPPMRPGRGPAEDDDPPEPRRFGGPDVTAANDPRAFIGGEAGFWSATPLLFVIVVVVGVGMRLLNHPPIRFPEGGD